MTKESTDNPIKVPAWLVRSCKWYWSQRLFFYSTITVNILSGIFTGWIFFDPTALDKVSFGTIFHQPFIFLVVFLCILFCTILSGLISRLGVPHSDRELKQRYLRHTVNETTSLTLKGIPAGLIAESVRLDEVFIPVELRRNRPRTDYPLTEQELEHYRQHLKRGTPSRNLERAVLEAEQNWQYVLKQSDRITIAELWEELMQAPAVVIQGYPGMGKSTLMKRLTLHMARRGLRETDSSMPEQQRLQPTLLPILISLGEYANACTTQQNLRLIEYVRKLLTAAFDAEPEILMPQFVERALKQRMCLVLFDGLDEVSDPQIRVYVQEVIVSFVKKYGDEVQGRRNHFIITSRVAGYDMAAFPDYPHYTIAELTTEQIDDFLPRWCRASIRRDRNLMAEDMATEVERTERELHAAIHDNQNVLELAQNPLLLTLLVVMQRNSITLPRQRVELYRVVTKTLLENRNIAKELEPIPEAQAMQRLGPIAFHMQAEDNSLARECDVMDSLQKTISIAGGTPVSIEREAQQFLGRIRERGGLFVLRSSDYFGFMHRSFQEYFAARYLLNQIKIEKDTRIEQLVALVCKQYAIWREPFLLAVAYQSSENERVASDIIRKLVDVSLSASREEQERNLLLAAESVIESKPLTIDRELELRIAEQILQLYEQALRERRFSDCKQIEAVMHHWLLSIPREAYRPALLAALLDAVTATNQERRQVVVLRLLAMLDFDHHSCSPVVFENLTPPLLALAGLPPAGRFVPTVDLPVSPNFEVLELAYTVLILMGKQGPTGQYIGEMRHYFKEHPEQLSQLARCSLECGTLISPALVPLAKDNYSCYEAAIQGWIALRDNYQKQDSTEQDVADCTAILQTTLNCAEDASYMLSLHVPQLLQTTLDNPAQSWQQNWQSYILTQLSCSSYLSYGELALLWIGLFPGQQEQQLLAVHILQHYQDSNSLQYRYAQRFIANLGNSMRYIRYMRNMRYIGYMRDVKAKNYMNYMIEMNYMIDTIYMKYMSSMRDMRYMGYMRDMSYISYTNYLHYMRYMKYIRNMNYMFYMNFLISIVLSSQNAEKACIALTSSSPPQSIDLLAILLGRILQIQEAKEYGEDIEQEVQRIAHTALACFTATRDAEAQEAVLDILRYLPARTANEITFILQLAESVSDTRIQDACVHALKYSNPQDQNAKTALATGKDSPIPAIRNAVEAVLQ